MTIPKRLKPIDIIDRVEQSPIYSPEVHSPYAAVCFSHGELQPSASELEESQFVEDAVRQYFEREYVKAERKRACVGAFVAIVRRLLR